MSQPAACSWMGTLINPTAFDMEDTDSVACQSPSTDVTCRETGLYDDVRR